MSRVHYVRKGDGLDSLTAISQYYQVSVEDLKKLNPALGKRDPAYWIDVGDKIILPSSADRRRDGEKTTQICQKCPDPPLIVSFVPTPPTPLPQPPGPATGEDGFSYDYALASTSVVMLETGSIDFNRGTTIMVHDAPATNMLQFVAPSFATETSGKDAIFWRKSWKTESAKTGYAARNYTLSPLPHREHHIFEIVNELPAAAEHMAKEMIANSKSNDVKSIRESLETAEGLEKEAQKYLANKNVSIIEGALNVRVASDLLNAAAIQRASATGQWAILVRTDGPWDHKKQFREGKVKVEGTSIGVWHTWGAWEYFYDPWSNIHFGYVGRACGFSKQTLIDGAEMEQSIQDTFKGGSGKDPEQDKIAISIGCELFDRKTKITAETLIRIVESENVFDRRPLTSTSMFGNNRLRRKAKK